mmetsp:Transcript_4594/g.8555  ORF Transcript_4594/g.8555 Transcript_4594/m.8555 type:complete len:122 (-) Transcript_4594:197-562(-)
MAMLATTSSLQTTMAEACDVYTMDIIGESLDLLQVLGNSQHYIDCREPSRNEDNSVPAPVYPWQPSPMSGNVAPASPTPAADPSQPSPTPAAQSPAAAATTNLSLLYTLCLLLAYKLRIFN